MENCRGNEKKADAVKRYDIWPKQHAVLLTGQRKHCCCGDRIAAVGSKYYRFQYVPRGRDRSTNPEEFFAAKSCADKFLSLTSEAGLKCINPLEPAPQQGGGGGGGGDDVNPLRRTPFNQELEQALNLFLYWLDGPSTGPSEKILTEIEKYPGRDRHDSTAKSVNTIIRKNGGGKTLMNMINDLRMRGNNIREYHFPIICRKLHESGEKNFIEPQDDD